MAVLMEWGRQAREEGQPLSNSRGEEGREPGEPVTAGKPETGQQTTKTDGGRLPLKI